MHPIAQVYGLCRLLALAALVSVRPHKLFLLQVKVQPRQRGKVEHYILGTWT